MEADHGLPFGPVYSRRNGAAHMRGSGPNLLAIGALAVVSPWDSANYWREKAVRLRRAQRGRPVGGRGEPERWPCGSVQYKPPSRAFLSYQSRECCVRRTKFGWTLAGQRHVER